jgi:hypothetical protein
VSVAGVSCVKFIYLRQGDCHTESAEEDWPNITESSSSLGLSSVLDAHDPLTAMKSDETPKHLLAELGRMDDLGYGDISPE